MGNISLIIQELDVTGLNTLVTELTDWNGNSGRLFCGMHGCKAAVLLVFVANGTGWI